MGRVFVRRERSCHTVSALVCGLGVHKESTYATILDANGEIVNQKRMSNSLVPSYLSDFRIDRTGYIAEAKIKSDRVDSKAIAELVRLDALPSACTPDPETAVLREKIWRRAFLVGCNVNLYDYELRSIDRDNVS